MSALRMEPAVQLRPIRSSDAPKLLDIFNGMGTHSRWLRFLAAKPRLLPHELRYFTEVDHHNHEAIVALGLPDRHGLGVARFVRFKADPECADVAVAVVDVWHGIGRALLTQLSQRAREEGVERFVATVSAQNAAVLALLQSAALVRPPVREFGTIEYEVDISSPTAWSQAS